MTNLELQLALQQVRLEELLAFSKGNQWSGRLKLMANFRTQAADLPTMLARLQGQGELELIHGSYQGLDLLAAVSRVGLVLKKRAGIPVKNPPPITLFDKLTTHFTLQQGILNSQDLTISAQDYTARGHGQLNLNSQLINLTLKASFKQLTQLCVPLTIRLLDHYRHPTIKIDYASLVQHGLQRLTERLSDRKVTDTLQKLFGIK